MMPSVTSGSQALRQCIHSGASMTAGARFASSPSVGQPAAGWWREQGRRRWQDVTKIELAGMQLRGWAGTAWRTPALTPAPCGRVAAVGLNQV